MKELLYKVLELSASGSLMILAVMLLRLVLRKAPRRIFCLLWLLVCLRLAVPFEIRSAISLQPELDAVITEKQPQLLLPQEDTAEKVEIDIIWQENPVDIPQGQPDTPQGTVSPSEKTETPASVTVDLMAILAWLWAAGAAGMLAYSIVSYWRLKYRVRGSVILEEGVWVCGKLDTAFVLGFFRPRIYLPVGLKDRERELILRHERIHIARLDHWTKPLTFAVLAVHWFNPLVWVAFCLLCRDMEMACDETVVKSMTVAERKAYSAALLGCSSREHHLAACPVAFGEIAVKRRILSVMNYRKKSVWVILAAAIAALTLAACFLTDPIQTDPVAEDETQPTVSEQDTANDEVTAQGFEDYVFRYEGRDREWEEDIVYMANTYLTQFPKVTKMAFLEYRMYQEYPGAYLITDNYLYDDEIRTEFIRAVNELLDRIPELNDTELSFETIRVKGTLRSAMTGPIFSAEEYFPIMVGQLEHEGELDYYTLRIPKEYAHLLYTRLTAINGIPLEEVMEILRPYTLGENIHWHKYLLTDRFWNSLIVNKPLLQTTGIVEWDADTAEFTLAADDGTETTVTLTAITSEEYRADDMAREDFYARGIGYWGLHSDQYYWYEVMPEENALYVRVSQCSEHSGYGFQTFLWEVTDILNAAKEPMKLIIDIRRNTGGNYPMSGYEEFTERLPKIATDGVYFLIDHSVGNSNWLVNEVEANMEVVLVGTPAGCSENEWGNAKNVTTPNGKIEFRLPTAYWRFVETMEDVVLMPDITVRQTLEDHKQGIDTVLEYVLAIGN